MVEGGIVEGNEAVGQSYDEVVEGHHLLVGVEGCGEGTEGQSRFLFKGDVVQFDVDGVLREAFDVEVTVQFLDSDVAWVETFGSRFVLFVLVIDGTVVEGDGFHVHRPLDGLGAVLFSESVHEELEIVGGVFFVDVGRHSYHLDGTEGDPCLEQVHQVEGYFCPVNRQKRIMALIFDIYIVENEAVWEIPFDFCQFHFRLNFFGKTFGHHIDNFAL